MSNTKSIQSELETNTEINDYRSEQALLLKKRFDMFIEDYYKNISISDIKYNPDTDSDSDIDSDTDSDFKEKKNGAISITNNTNTTNDFKPLESINDINIIGQLIQSKTFCIVPAYDKTEPTKITHYYTLGMWYYWGLPEIIILLDNPIEISKINGSYINILFNIIQDKLFKQLSDKIENNNKSINRIEHKENYVIDIKEFNYKLNLKKLADDKYLEHNISYLFWFHMFYMDLEYDSDKKPKLFPVYYLNVDSDKIIKQ